MEIGDIREKLGHSRRSLFSPGNESFLVSLPSEDASSVIEQRFDQFSRSGRGTALSLATIARPPLIGGLPALITMLVVPTIELRSDDEERQIADQMCSSRLDDEETMQTGVLCG